MHSAYLTEKFSNIIYCDKAGTNSLKMFSMFNKIQHTNRQIKLYVQVDQSDNKFELNS